MSNTIKMEIYEPGKDLHLNNSSSIINEKTDKEHLEILDALYEDMHFERKYALTDGTPVQLPTDTFMFKTREMAKCMEDPIYFAENYYNIVSLDKGQHVIKTYPKQAELINTMIKDDRVCVLASRQTGKTTSYCIFAAWIMCFNRDKRILVIANKQETALEIMSRIMFAFELLPKWLKPGVKEWNKGKIKLTNGCIIQGSSTTADSARSKSCNILLIDECAFIPSNIMNKLWESVYPIISSSKDTKCVMVSTPNGTGNLFYDTYNNGLVGKNDGAGDNWTPFRIDWWDVPGRDEEWKEKQLISFNYDMKKFNQEFGNSFLGSTYTLVDLGIMVKKKEEHRKFMLEPTELLIEENNIMIWENPKPDHCYTIGCDVADGTGNDYSVITIFDITHPTKKIPEVAYFCDNKITPPRLAYILAKLGWMYNESPLMIEANSMGETVVEFLHLIYEYSNIISIGHRKLGILSNNKVKVNACQTFRSYIDHPKLNVIIRNPGLHKELEYFEKADTGTTFTYRATKGRHDDHVMSAVWALYILKESNIEFFYNVELIQLGIERFPSVVTHFDQSYKNEQIKSSDLLDKIYKEIHNKDIESVDEIEISDNDDYNPYMPEQLGFMII